MIVTIALAVLVSAAPELKITRDALSLDGKSAMTAAELDAEAGPKALTALLAGHDGAPRVVIHAAADVPYRMLGRVVFTCAEAGFTDPLVDASGPPLTLALPPPLVTMRIAATGATVWVNGGKSDAALPDLKRKHPALSMVVVQPENDVPAKTVLEALASIRAASLFPVLSMLADEAAPEVIGVMPKEAVAGEFKKNRGQIRYCYEARLLEKPDLAGKVVVKFTIKPDGSVARASVAESTLHDEKMEACVLGRVKTWTFPKPGGGGSVNVTYPFLFKLPEQ
jgi:TonB family protein